MAIPGRGACVAPGGAAVRGPPGSNLSVNPEGSYYRLSVSHNSGLESNKEEEEESEDGGAV